MMSSPIRALITYAHLIVVMVLVLVSLLVWGTADARDGTPMLTVAFLDVGQGDAVFIESPNGNHVLIDGGKGRAVLEALGSVMSPWDRSIDVVMATHPDLDHIGGLPNVFARYNVGMFIDPGVQDSGADYRALTAAVQTEGLVPIRGRSGMTLDLGGGAVLEIIFPDRDMDTADPNVGSIVVRLTYGSISFLLTGDSPATVETYLVDRYQSALESTVLKLGHHGSRTSSSEPFLDAVAPQYAVISVGCDNTYGHPHHEVVDRLAARHIDTLNTCTDGTIRFSSDGITVVRQ